MLCMSVDFTRFTLFLSSHKSSLKQHLDLLSTLSPSSQLAYDYIPIETFVPWIPTLPTVFNVEEEEGEVDQRKVLGKVGIWDDGAVEWEMIWAGLIAELTGSSFFLLRWPSNPNQFDISSSLLFSAAPRSWGYNPCASDQPHFTDLNETRRSPSQTFVLVPHPDIYPHLYSTKDDPPIVVPPILQNVVRIVRAQPGSKEKEQSFWDVVRSMQFFILDRPSFRSFPPLCVSSPQAKTTNPD